MNRILALVAVSLVALLGAGCANGEPDEVWHGDTAFTAEERAAIEEGAAFTAAHVGAPTPVIVWTGIDQGRSHRSIERATPPDPGASGEAGRGWMWISPGSGAPLAAHEFGHTFCLVHHDDAGLMNPYVQAGLEWTAADQDDADSNACP